MTVGEALSGARTIQHAPALLPSFATTPAPRNRPRRGGCLAGRLARERWQRSASAEPRAPSLCNSFGTGRYAWALGQHVLFLFQRPWSNGIDSDLDFAEPIITVRVQPLTMRF